MLCGPHRGDCVCALVEKTRVRFPGHFSQKMTWLTSTASSARRSGTTDASRQFGVAWISVTPFTHPATPTLGARAFVFSIGVAGHAGTSCGHAGTTATPCSQPWSAPHTKALWWPRTHSHVSEKGGNSLARFTRHSAAILVARGTLHRGWCSTGSVLRHRSHNKCASNRPQVL